MSHFFGILIVAGIMLAGAHPATAQDKSIAFTVYGASGMASSGYNTTNIGTMLGGGVDFSPGGMGFGLKFLLQPRQEESSNTYYAWEGLDGERGDDYLNGPAFQTIRKWRSTLLAGTPQYDIGPRKSPVIFRIGAGPGLFFQPGTIASRTLKETPDFQYNPDSAPSTYNFYQIGLVGSGSLIVKVRSWGTIEAGALFFKPFTNTDQVESSSYWVPIGGVGITF